jgi:uncharacterized protein YndB with AHSA1/START domain
MTEPFTISRIYAAPRPLVFSCFTEVERMRHWWGPKGAEIVSSQMDFRVGGTYHYAMKPMNGDVMWGRFFYTEIVVPERIVLVSAFSNAAGGITRAPFFDGKWPLEMLSTFSFRETPNGGTELTISWAPLGATAEEEAVFDANRPSMTGGWTGSLDRLGDYLTTR